MGDTPRDVVESFFAKMSEGGTARESVGELFRDDATISLPGATFSGLSAANDFLQFLAPRYEWADKSFDRWIETGNEVISIGTLYGETNAGAEFTDVRYIDVYTIDPNTGLIARLDIWNDLAVDGVVSIGEAGQ